MKTRVSFFLLIALSWSTQWSLAQSADATFNFENDEVGKLPADWMAATGTWMIASDGGNKAMKQAGANEGEMYNICIQNKLKYQNLEMEVRIKPLEGKEDQGGGLVWRYRDEKNYYIARANPLEDNFRVYRVVNGNRKQLQSSDVKFKVGEWYAIKVVMSGSNISCSYNGQKLLSLTDDTYKDAGNIGFWSKADAVSLFDDFKVKAIK
jgi:hypothetical protein